MINYSIIIPHKNSTSLVIKLINSIVFREDIEIIIVDDNSTEKEIEKLTEYVEKLKDYNITLLSNKYSTAGGARNTGMEVATGRWFIFSDADDIFTKRAFEYFDKYLHSEKDLIFFRVQSKKYNQLTEEVGSRDKYFNDIIDCYIRDKNNISEFNLKYKYIVPWGKMIKREIIDDNGIFFDETFVANDVMFSTKVSYYSNNIEASTDEVYIITERNDNLSSKKDKENLLIRNQTFINQFIFLKENLTNNKIVSKQLKSKYFIGVSFKQHGFVFAMKELIKMKRKGISLFNEVI